MNVKRAIIGGGRPGMSERVRGMRTDLVMTDDPPPDIRICKPGRERYPMLGCTYCEDGMSKVISYPCRMCGNEKRILTHKEAYQIMMEAGPNADGRYLDPVSNRLFPVGRAMLEKPNRKQRRRLEAWRRTGRVKGQARCEVQG